MIWISVFNLVTMIEPTALPSTLLVMQVKACKVFVQKILSLVKGFGLVRNSNVCS